MEKSNGGVCNLLQNPVNEQSAHDECGSISNNNKWAS